MDVFYYSPLLIIPVLMMIVIGVFSYFYKKREFEEARTLLKFFGAKNPAVFGSINFNFAGSNFRLKRLSTGGGINSVRGTFPVLWAYTETFQKAIIGNPRSKDFTRGKFLILPPYQVVEISGNDLLIGAQSEESIRMITDKILKDPILSKDIFNLFGEDFSHLTLSSEIHIGGKALIAKKSVLYYFGLPETIYKSPEILERRLRIITAIADNLGFRFK